MMATVIDNNTSDGIANVNDLNQIRNHEHSDDLPTVEQIDQQIRHVWDRSTTSSVTEYRGFLISRASSKRMIDRLYQQIETADTNANSVSEPDQLEQIIRHYGMENGTITDLDQHLSSLDCAQLLHECSLIEQERNGHNWTLVSVVDKENSTDIRDLPASIVSWIYRYKKTFYKLIEKRLEIMIQNDHGWNSVYYFLFNIGTGHNPFVIRSRLFGSHPVRARLINKLLELIHGGSFLSWLIFNYIFPSYGLFSVYPVMNLESPNYNPEIIRNEIRNDYLMYDAYQKFIYALQNRY